MRPHGSQFHRAQPGTEGSGCGDAAAKLNGFDGLEAHDGLGEEAVEALVPVDVGCRCRAGGRGRTTSKMPPMVSPVRRARSTSAFMRGFGLGVDAPGEEDVFPAGEGGDFSWNVASRGELGGAYAGDVAWLPQFLKRGASWLPRSAGYAGGASARALASLRACRGRRGSPYLRAPARSAWPGRGRGDGLVLFGVARFDGEGSLSSSSSPCWRWSWRRASRWSCRGAPR